MKRPSLQFYVGDWQSNTNLRRCTFAEKGIWIEVMCLMHDAEQYGVLRWPLKEIAQAVGCKLSELKSLANKGVLKGADSGQKCEEYVYTPRSGGKDGDPVVLISSQAGPIWYSSRMVRDDYVSKNRGKGTRFGEQKPPPEPLAESPPTRRIGERQGEEPSQREEDGPSIFSLQSSTQEGEISAQPNAARDDFFRKCFERIVGVFPALMTANPSPIHQWKLAGYDYDMHVKPAVDTAAVKKAQPRSFKFFTPMLEDAARPIAKAPAKETPVELTPDKREELKEWKKKMGMHA
jgi:hypothetical protein